MIYQNDKKKWSEQLLTTQDLRNIITYMFYNSIPMRQYFLFEVLYINLF